MRENESSSPKREFLVVDGSVILYRSVNRVYASAFLDELESETAVIMRVEESHKKSHKNADLTKGNREMAGAC